MLIGVGNSWRGDDAAGIEVARRAGGACHEGDCAGLLDLWSGSDEVTIVDASSSGLPPGSVRRFDAGVEPLPARMLRSSTHSFGVAEAIEIARTLGLLPTRVVVYAIEGADFAAGERLSPAVEEAVRDLAGRIPID